MSAPKLSILILNWNGWQDTIECLASLQKSTYPNVEFVLLDNGSTDDSCARIGEWATGAHTPQDCPPPSKPMTVMRYTREEAERGGDLAREATEFHDLPPRQRLILIDNNANLGFAAGNNVGVRFALQRDTEYVLLLNNDTLVDADALTHLVEFLQVHPDYAGVTGQIRYAGRDAIWNCGGDLTWYGSRRYHYHGVPAAQTPQSGWRRITFMTGCAALLRADLLHEVGLLTERFFFGEEDYEFSLRLRTQNRLLACCYSAIIYHKVGQSIQKRSNQKVLRSTYIYQLSRAIDLRQHWSPLRWLFWRQLSMTYTLPMLWLRYHIPVSKLWLLRRRLLYNSIRLNGVDRYTFEQEMHNDSDD